MFDYGGSKPEQALYSLKKNNIKILPADIGNATVIIGTINTTSHDSSK